MYYIIGMSSCPYYIKALELLKEKKHTKLEFNREKWSNVLEITKNLIGNHKTSPIIFNDGKFIGGCDSILTMFSNK